MASRDRETERKPRVRIEIGDNGVAKRIDLGERARRLQARRAEKKARESLSPIVEDEQAKAQAMAERRADFLRRQVNERAERQRAKMISEALRETKVDGSGPTRLTTIKHQRTSFERMLISKEIDGTMLQAAQEISAVYMALCGALVMRGFSFEPKSRATAPPMAERIAIAHAKRYLPWAEALSSRARVGGPPTLAIVIDVVVDGRGCATLDRERNYMSGRTKYLVRRGLLEYAQMAGWAPRDALKKFDDENPKFAGSAATFRSSEEIA
jgi:hypothetical protein